MKKRIFDNPGAALTFVGTIAAATLLLTIVMAVSR